MTVPTGKLRRFLRAEAHSLKPIVHIGKQGLAPAVLRQIDAALESHELIKVQYGADKAEKARVSALLEAELGAATVGQVGHMLILFRRQEDPDKRVIELPRELEVD
jgi:RNA-binding protein